MTYKERVAASVVSPDANEKTLFLDTDGKLKTKDENGVVEELSTDLTGVIDGGTTGQLLAKASDTDGDIEWVDAPSGGGGASYLVYSAILNQTGTNNPVATVFENTLGGTVVWTRVSEGYYIGTLAGAFPSDKTFILYSSIFDVGSLLPALPNISGQINVIEITLATSEGTKDGLLNNTSIEVRVYP